MMSEAHKRINKLDLSVSLLEDHLLKYGDLIPFESLHFIKQRIHNFRREIRIRKDFPS